MWTEWLKRWMEMAFWWLPQDRNGGGSDAGTGSRSGARSAHSANRPLATNEGERDFALESSPSEGKRDTTESAESAPPAAPSSDERADAAAEKPAEKPAEDAAKPKAAAAASGKSDDLTAIKGIGATMQQRLAELGIRSFEDLAGSDADTLTEQLKARQMVISRERVDSWIAAARERA